MLIAQVSGTNLTGNVVFREGLIERGRISVNASGELAGVSRATVYARRKPQVMCEVELLLCRLIDEEYTRRPFYGSRKIVPGIRSNIPTFYFPTPT